MSRRKNRISTLHWLTLGMFLSLAIAGILYLRFFYTPPTQADFKEQGKEYIEEVASQLSITPHITETKYWDWIEENNQMLPLTGYEFFIGTTNTSGTGLYKGITSNSLENVNMKFITRLADTAGTFFKQKGFKEDKKNRRGGANDPLHTVYRGYTRGQIKCLVRLNPQSDPFGTIFCGTVDAKQQALQKQVPGLFSSTYNPKKPSSYRVDVIQGDFVRGSYSESVLGYVFIAKQTDNTWAVIWKGEELPLCSDMEQLGIPKSIYKSCYSE